MAPIIRIDQEVYSWLQKQGRPFEDTPNSVLRRIAGLNDVSTERDEADEKHKTKTELSLQHEKEQSMDKQQQKKSVPSRMTRGEVLNRKWNVGARHALYHKDGHFFNNLQIFPGALFDPEGYVIFKTEEDYLKCPYLKIGKEKTNVYKTISAIPGYVRKIS